MSLCHESCTKAIIRMNYMNENQCNFFVFLCINKYRCCLQRECMMPVCSAFAGSMFGVATGSIHIFAACRHEMCLLCIGLHYTFELYTCTSTSYVVPQTGKLPLMIHCHYIVKNSSVHFACVQHGPQSVWARKFQSIRPIGRHMPENNKDRELFNRYNIAIRKIKNGIKCIDMGSSINNNDKSSMRILLEYAYSAFTMSDFKVHLL